MTMTLRLLQQLKHKEKIKTELLAANKIGVTDGQVEVTDGADDAAGKTTYTIQKVMQQ